jgi:hypothetical protein
MKKQHRGGAQLVVLRLDNGELGVDVMHGDLTANETVESPGVQAGHGAFEIVESHDLPAELLEVDPAALSQVGLSGITCHPSTGQRSHPSQIEKEP